MIYIQNDTIRKKIGRLAKDWLSQNFTTILVQSFAFGLITSFILIPFDYAFFGSEAIKYLYFRILSILIFSVPLIIYLWNAKKNFSKMKKRALNYYAIGSLIFFNGFYIYFLETTKDDHKSIVIAALFMNIFACQLLFNKAWKNHVSILGLYACAFSAGTALSSANSNLYKSFLLWNLILGFFFWFQRRSFMSSLYQQYSLLLYQYSPRIARSILFNGNESSYLEAFKPQLRPCVCICIDWRSFQELAARSSPETISMLLEKSHEALLDIVFQAVPNETFHADWSADEFFVTLYSDSNNTDELLLTSTHLIQSLQNDFYKKAESSLGAQTPIIDLGAAYGESVVGLVGPKNMKKMTALGDVGGRAKRYQTEAKTIRGTIRSLEKFCVVVVDPALYQRMENQTSHYKDSFFKHQAETKNISGTSIYYSVGLESKAPSLKLAS